MASRTGRAAAAVDARHDEEIAAERREAARLLLTHPLLTATGPHADGFRLVRRHADPLKALFLQHLGYRLIVESGFARLVKPGLGRESGRRLVRSTGAPFTPRGYAYLTLALTVLVTSAEQILLSQVIAGIRTAAVDAGIELGEPDRQAERRTIAAALRQLVAWGVLTEVDGTVLAYVDDQKKDALLQVDREVARAIVAGPIRTARTPAELVEQAADAGPGGPRHAVRRLLIETPVVYLDDLTPEERGWLRQQQRREQRIFDEQFGLDLEIRAEGVLLVDPAEGTTDTVFPGTGTVAQAALLVAGRLVERLRPADAGHPATGARLVIGVPVPDPLLDLVIMQVTADYAESCGWARHYVDDQAALRRDVCDLLVSMRLLAPADAIPRADARADAQAQVGTPPAGTGATPSRAMASGAMASRVLASGEAADPAPGLDPAEPERRVTDTAGARGGAAEGRYVLLAAAARFRPALGATQRPQRARSGRVRPARPRQRPGEGPAT